MEKIFSKLEIRAIAATLPKEILKLENLSEVYGADTVKKIIKNTGITEVHVAPENKTSADYCVAAAQKIFGETEISPEIIDAIIFVTETPDYLVPHTAAILQSRLNLPNRVISMDINYGCAGYVYGIFQAALLIETGYCKNVLLCVGDTPTKYINEHDKALRMVFGDAGSATILSEKNSAQNSAFNFFTDGAQGKNLMVQAGGFRMPRKIGVTDILNFDENGNGRTLENISMDGMEIMNFVLKNIKRVIYETLEILNLPPSEINLFALHQANILISNYLTKRLKVAAEKVPFGAGKTGNTTCVSIPLMLSTLFAGVNPALKKVVICGFGTGLTCAAGVVDLSGTKIFAPSQI